jgi:hypothetical protein
LASGRRTKPDWIAKQLEVREQELKDIFGKDGRERCSLVATDRPAPVRKADRKADQYARQRAKRRRDGMASRNEYEAQARADRAEAERLRISYAAARKRRQRACPKSAVVPSLPNIPPVGSTGVPTLGTETPSISTRADEPAKNGEGWEGFEKAWQAQKDALEAVAAERRRAQGIEPEVRTEPMIKPREGWERGFRFHLAARRQLRGCVDGARRGSPSDRNPLARQISLCTAVNG